MFVLILNLYLLQHKPPLSAQAQGAILVASLGEGTNTDLFNSRRTNFNAHENPTEGQTVWAVQLIKPSP